MEKYQFNQENATSLPEGQSYENQNVMNEVTKNVEPLVEPVEVIEESEMLQSPELSSETQVSYEPQFEQVEPMQSMYCDGNVTSTEFTQGQGNVFLQTGMPQVKKSKKKMITLIVSAIVVLILVVLGGLYGYSVHTKSQALETIKNERNVTKKKSDELQEKAVKYESLNNMKKFEMCISGKGIESGKAFTLSTSKYDGFQIVEKSSSTIETELNRCKEKVADIKLDGAKELIDLEIQKIGETYQANVKFIEEIKTAQKQWAEFKSAWRSGTVEEAEFNRIRALAATAIGVEPTTLGNDFSYTSISIAFDRRVRAIENKQVVRSGEEIRSFISKNLQEGESESNIEDLYQDRQSEFQEAKNELDQKEKELKEKEAKVWNPFQ